ncbi:MAG: RdgB/HAM1 family non-canonical purine NTP pyrophosphatase [Pseudomonadota bacterium]|nr:RdgB/HAM1 family non-canonical purine NTP pyrophosphatase [Pseudomonadota bacterium]
MKDIAMARRFSGTTLVLATHNPGKLKEFGQLFPTRRIALVTAADLGLAAPAETGETLRDNALLKARAVARVSGQPALADDSGLCVEALGGQPGVHSADWAETGEGRNYQTAMEKIHTLLGPSANRRAQFVCCLALAWPDGHAEVVEGRDEGEIVWPPRGTGEFGYDPVFRRLGETRTNAELSPDEKNAGSHRAKALRLLLERCFS